MPAILRDVTDRRYLAEMRVDFFLKRIARLRRNVQKFATDKYIEKYIVAPLAVKNYSYFKLLMRNLCNFKFY